jgi:hypothetical protein
MRASLLLPIVTVAFTLVGCGTAAVAEGEAPPIVASAPGPSPIAMIVSRDRSITLLAGGGTVRATVVDASGRLVAHQVPIDELETIDATAYEACHSSFADAHGSLDAHIGGNAESTASIKGW